MKRKYGVVLAITILLTIVIFLTLFYASNERNDLLEFSVTKSQDNHWIMYEDSEVGFSLQYPNGWYMHETLTPEEPGSLREIGIANWNFSKYFPGEADVDLPIRINLYTEKSDLSINEYFEGRLVYSAKYYEEDIKIGGIGGKKIKTEGMGKNISVLVKYGDNIISFYVDDEVASEEVLDKIVQTIMFN